MGNDNNLLLQLTIDTLKEEHPSDDTLIIISSIAREHLDKATLNTINNIILKYKMENEGKSKEPKELSTEQLKNMAKIMREQIENSTDSMTKEFLKNYYGDFLQDIDKELEKRK